MLKERRKSSKLTSAGVMFFPIFATISIIYMFYTIYMQKYMFKQGLIIETGAADSSYLIDTPGCRIPNLKAWSPIAKQYMYHVFRFRCGIPPLVESNDTHLQIVDKALPQYGVADPKLLTCCYRSIWRNVPNVSVDDDGNINEMVLKDEFLYDRDVRNSSVCNSFSDSAEIQHEFVRVECGVYKEKYVHPVYTDYHAFFPRPPEANMRNDETSHTPKLNILFLGIDSLSRLNTMRKLTRTRTFITEKLKGIPMFGYNKIALNTFPNLIPLFSGMTKKALEKRCWPDFHHHFDLCPWIWKKFSERGYVTAFMEDSINIGLFNYFKTGFIFQPTDYYSTTLFSAALNEDNLNTYCMGQRNQIEVLLQYTHKHLRAMKRFRKKFFSISWGVALSHDDVNTAELNDELYFNLLRDIEREGILNETFLVFMSDHGARFGDFLETRQGQLEDSLPMLFLIIPEWFQRMYPTAMDNVRINQYRLLTTLDLHQTILDLLDPVRLETDKITRRTKEKEQHIKDPVSLFLPISDRRTCEDAAIPAEFCACQHLRAIPLDDPIVNKVASFVVSSINQKVRDFPSCISHSLKKVHSAESGPPLYKVKHGGENIKEYRVTLYTKPSNAFYEALVRYTTGDDSFQLVGEVSRLNAYGHQADCMPVYTLLPFCYCKTESHSVQTMYL